MSIPSALPMTQLGGLTLNSTPTDTCGGSMTGTTLPEQHQQHVGCRASCEITVWDEIPAEFLDFHEHNEHLR